MAHELSFIYVGNLDMSNTTEECKKLFELHTREIFVKASHSCISMQQLHKQLVLYKHYMERQQVGLDYCKEISNHTASENGLNKEDLDRSNVKRKWLDFIQ